MAQFNQNNSKKTQPPRPGTGASNLPVPVGYFEISEGKCKICQSAHRREIDMMLATGWSQASARRHWNQVLEPTHGSDYFTHANFSNHARKHLTTKDAAVRRIYEERARQMGMDIDKVEGFIVTRQAVLDTIIHSGLEALHLGHTVAESRDVLQAVQLLEKLESEHKEQAIDELLRDFKAFMEAVKEVVGEDMYETIYERFEGKLDNSNPHLVSPLPADVIIGRAEEVIEDAELEDED